MAARMHKNGRIILQTARKNIKIVRPLGSKLVVAQVMCYEIKDCYMRSGKLCKL